MRNVLAAIDRVAQLVEHRAHPVFVGHDVGQHPHVAFAVDVGAKGVGALAGLFVEVAAGDHVVDRQADARIKIAAKLEDIGLRVHRIEIGGENRRRFLKKRIVVMPGPEVGDRDSALFGQLAVDLELELRERLAGEVIELVEQFQDLVLRLLVQVKLELVIVGETRACAPPRSGA